MFNFEFSAYPEREVVASIRDLNIYSEEVRVLEKEYDLCFNYSSDVVINIHGGMSYKKLMEVSPTEFDEVIDVNLRRTQWVSKLVTVIIKVVPL